MTINLKNKCNNTKEIGGPNLFIELCTIEDCINDYNKKHEDSEKQLEYISNKMYVVKWKHKGRLFIVSKTTTQEERQYTYIRNEKLYKTILVNIINRGETIANQRESV